jgi:2-dehydro-3-deoxygluconokinase
MNIATKTIDIIGIGEAMVEFNQQADARFLLGTGGDTSNAIIAGARLGAKTAYLTHVGGDVFGDALLAMWSKEGVQVADSTRVADGETGIYFVSHDSNGHRFTYRRKGSAASLMTPQSLPLDMIAQSRWLHCSGISLAISASAADTAFEAIAIAKRSNTKRSYDLNFRPSLCPAPRALAFAKSVIEGCDLFLPSIDEMAALTGLSDPNAIIAWGYDHGAKVVVVKLGARGALLSEGNHLQEIAPHPVVPIDATGAGDCFAGAMLARLCAGDAYPQATRVANIAAALSTLGHGAVAPLPRTSEIDSVMKLKL